MTIYQLHNVLETLSILKFFKYFIFYENNLVLHTSSTDIPLKKSVFWIKILKGCIVSCTKWNLKEKLLKSTFQEAFFCNFNSFLVCSWVKVKCY